MDLYYSILLYITDSNTVTMSFSELKIILQLLKEHNSKSSLSKINVSLVDDCTSDDEESIPTRIPSQMSSQNLKIEPPGITGRYKGCGLILRYPHAYRSNTMACKTGISFEELKRILYEWDETRDWKSVVPHAMPNSVSNDEWDDYLPRLVPLTEDLSNYRIFHLEKEETSTWVKYIIYNKKTKKYILRSATGEPIPPDYKGKQSWGKIVSSHCDGWYVNKTNIISDKTFWKRVKQRVALY